MYTKTNWDAQRRKKKETQRRMKKCNQQIDQRKEKKTEKYIPRRWKMAIHNRSAIAHSAFRQINGIDTIRWNRFNRLFFLSFRHIHAKEVIRITTVCHAKMEIALLEHD